MKKHLDLLLLITSLTICGLSFLFNNDLAILLTMLISFLGFPILIKFPITKIPDEREVLLHQKSSTTTLAVTITLLFLSILALDFSSLQNTWTIKFTLEVFLVLIYQVYLLSYVVYKRTL